jgi:endonuclease/exonuclease/phosphatase family metal-dependent hydrolase
VSFDPYAPYGPLIESTIRVVTWNVWGRYGPDPEARQAALEQALEQTKPDLICLVEAWRQGKQTQPARIAARLGLPHHTFAGDREEKQDDWVSGIGFVSRWPMTEPRRHPLRAEDGSGSGQAVHVTVAAERGPIQLFAVLLDYPLDASGLRQHQVRQLVRFIAETTAETAAATTAATAAETAPRRDLVVVCGDFNAGPDSDEIRMLTGRSAPAVPGLVFYDAWELAGDASPGFTWSNRNPLAAVGLYPDRRFDYIFTAWPRRGGVGHPVRCSLLGVRVPGGQQLSDHYGLAADLRY